jgi:hypothetical protein
VVAANQRRRRDGERSLWFVRREAEIELEVFVTVLPVLEPAVFLRLANLLAADRDELLVLDERDHHGFSIRMTSGPPCVSGMSCSCWRPHKRTTRKRKAYTLPVFAVN